MLKRMPPRPSPAMIVAIVALVGAFGGSAIAGEVVDLAKKKVIPGSTIKKRSIRANRLAKDTLGGTEINESKLGKVPSATNADKAVNATNATNATNASNADKLDSKDSTAFVSNLIVRSVTDPLLDGTTAVDDANCLPGERATGGGVRIPLTGPDLTVGSTRPTDGAAGVPADGSSAKGWRGVASNSNAAPNPNSDTTMTVFVICSS